MRLIALLLLLLNAGFLYWQYTQPASPSAPPVPGPVFSEGAVRLSLLGEAAPAATPEPVADAEPAPAQDAAPETVALADPQTVLAAPEPAPPSDTAPSEAPPAIPESTPEPVPEPTAQAEVPPLAETPPAPEAPAAAEGVPPPTPEAGGTEPPAEAPLAESGVPFSPPSLDSGGLDKLENFAEHLASLPASVARSLERLAPAAPEGGAPEVSGPAAAPAESLAQPAAGSAPAAETPEAPALLHSVALAPSVPALAGSAAKPPLPEKSQVPSAATERQPEKKASQVPPAKPAAPAKSAKTAALCFRVGPYADRQAAEKAGQHAALVGGRIHIQAKPESGRDTNWVYLPPYASREAARAEQARLDRLGIRDHYVVSAPPFENAVSLGAYRDDDGAARRAAELRAKGFHNVKIQPRAKGHTLYWVETKLPAEQQYALQAGFNPAQGPAPEKVACGEIAIRGEIP